jgi:hypothetical protein
MTITVANYITQYLRTTLVNAVEFTDAVLGYWIDAALLDISRSFPRKTYATWNAVTGTYSYAYADSLTVADETTIIRVLNCLYPYVSTSSTGRPMYRKNHLDENFIGSDYYDPDSDAQVLYIGAAVATGNLIYCDCHIYWKTATAVIINPSEHLELIRLFCIWQAFLHQAADSATSAVPDSSLLNSLALEARRAEIAYQSAYTQLAESKATSMYTDGWIMDKWDQNSPGSGPVPGDPGSRRFHPT